MRQTAPFYQQMIKVCSLLSSLIGIPKRKFMELFVLITSTGQLLTPFVITLDTNRESGAAKVWIDRNLCPGKLKL